MVIGERTNKTMATNYLNNPVKGFTESFINTANAIYDGTGFEVMSESAKSLRNKSAYDAMKKFFIEGSYDPNLSQEEVEDHVVSMEAYFENDKEAILNENVNMGSYNPVIGITFPMHKLILMNMVFDKGAIPKFVAQSPKFTLTMEYRILVDPEGNEIDMFKEQNKMADAMRAVSPDVTFEYDMTTPLTEETEIVHDKLNGTAGVDDLSIDTYVCAVKISGVDFEKGDVLPNADGYVERGGKIATEDKTGQDVWVRIKGQFLPAYGDNGRVLFYKFVYQYKHKKSEGDWEILEAKEVLTGNMKNNRLVVVSAHGNETIKAIRITSKLDTSNARRKTCSVKWKEITDIVEIGNANPINTTISPEEVKDINALYNINQLTKIMSMMKTTLGEYKDAEILRHLNESYNNLPDIDRLWAQFDFAPRAGYTGNHNDWRRETFFEFLDYHVTALLQQLNDPNMTITVFGSPQLVRMITPTEYQYQSPSAIGPVELDFKKTVATSDKRVYQFIGSDKLRNNTELIIILCPRGTDRIVYRIYDYQMYISNEIRNFDNPALPAIHAFERWKFVEYQPVQGRMNILHPAGIVPETYNYIPTTAEDVNVAGRAVPTADIIG